MKKFLLPVAAALMAAGCYAFPKALYVKKGDSFTKFNFGVAEDLRFSEDGRYLNITGYNETIDLDAIDYITFTAPVSTTALTPDAQKERLISIADKVNEMAVPEKEADMIGLFGDFFIDGGDEETSQGWVWHRPVCEYAWPEGFWTEKNSADAITGLMKAVSSAVSLDCNTGAPLMASALNVYRFADYTGVFTANHSNNSWTKTANADYLELRYVRYLNPRISGHYAVRLEASDDYWTFDTSDFNSRVPRKLTLTFWKNDTRLATTTIDFDIVQNQHIYADIILKSNVTESRISIKITDSAIESKTISYVEGKYLNDSYAKIDGFGFMDYDMMKADYNAARDYEDETTWETVEGDHERLNRHFVKATAETDIINELQGFGVLFDYKGYRNARELAATYIDSEDLVYPDGAVRRSWPVYNLGIENGIINTAESKEENHIALINYLNRKSDIQFAYDKTGKTQGFVTWEVRDKIDDYVIPTGTDGDSAPQYGYYLKDGKAFRIYYRTVNEYIPPTASHPEPQEILHKFYGEEEWVNGKLVIHSFPEESLVFPVIDRTHYYENVPKLVFSDLTGFYFDDFFTSQAFNGPIGHYNKLIDAYFTITGIERNDYDK